MERLRCNLHPGWQALDGLGIKQVDDVAQAVAVLGQQIAQFGLKFDFFLQFRAALQGFELCEQGGKLLFNWFDRLEHTPEQHEVGIRAPGQFLLCKSQKVLIHFPSPDAPDRSDLPSERHFQAM